MQFTFEVPRLIVETQPVELQPEEICEMGKRAWIEQMAESFLVAQVMNTFFCAGGSVAEA